MANFEQALKKTLEHEGGYVNDPDDPGGETYKGIARKMHPNWEGWGIIAKRGLKAPELDAAVADFYRKEFWKFDLVTSQLIAESIFDFGVNAGMSTSVRLAQRVLEIDADGVLGANTIKAINEANEEAFLAAYTVAKVYRYVSICKNRPTSKKYLYGWLCRTLNTKP